MPNPNDLYGRPWSEPEYLMVLDAYFDLRGRSRHRDLGKIKDLVRLTGRTPASILMRMENFASLEPERNDDRSGLGNVPQMGRQLFNKWVSKVDQLKDCAAVLRRQADIDWVDKRNLFDLDPISIPKAFGKYELLDCVGRGSFGSVFSCVNVRTEEVRALKIIHVDRIHEREAAHRFCREIRALKQVDNPNVITIREDNLADEDDFPAFIMNLADTNLTNYANSLFEKQSQRPILPTSEAIRVIRGMINALRALHLGRPRIVHRDLNPNNILRMPDGRWVLADFGLVKFLGTAAMSTSFHTGTQQGLGTAYYTAPEQYLDLKRTDERVDIYSLGILMWELLTHSFPPPDRSNPGLPPELAQVFLRATERSLERRFQSIEEFSQAFEALDSVSSEE